jgi:hypothetical protein
MAIIGLVCAFLLDALLTDWAEKVEGFFANWHVAEFIQTAIIRWPSTNVAAPIVWNFFLTIGTGIPLILIVLIALLFIPLINIRADSSPVWHSLLGGDDDRSQRGWNGNS